jgi:hypothetical protein
MRSDLSYDERLARGRAEMDLPLSGDVVELFAQPVDIFGNLAPIEFPANLLPRVIADYSQDQAELIGVDPAVIGMAAIGVAAAALDDRIQIQPKRFDPTWTESARLWIGIVGDPSAKKSPGIKMAMAPAFKKDQDWREETARVLAEWEKRCDDAGKNGEKPPAPVEKRLIVNDVTVEKLADILAKSHPRGILTYQDELSGWLASMDAYKAGSGGKDKAAWLEAYNGGPRAVDRVVRGSQFVQNFSACVLGGIQPAVIQAYANSANHDGMLQRFVLIHAGEARLGKDRRPDMEARKHYSDLICHLADLQHSDDVVVLSDDAHIIREALDKKLHRFTVSHPNKYLTAALGKWSGLFARLLLVFHACDAASTGQHPVNKKVTSGCAKQVSDLLLNVLLPHAIKFYQGLDTAEDNARDIAALLLARRWERFTVKRDLNRHLLKSRKLKPWELDEALDRLESFSWITPEIGKINERGRPAAYEVNPSVHERYTEHAERERKRRSEVVELMREIKK